MLHEWIVFLRAGLFAGAVVFINYDLFAWVKEIMIERINAAVAAGFAERVHAVHRFRAEVFAFAVFLLAVGVHRAMRKLDERGLFVFEVAVIFMATVLAYFTFGFDKLGGLLLSVFSPEVR